MTFLESIKTCFSKYATFSGRASRSEFWWWYLFNVIINLVVYFLSFFVGLFAGLTGDETIVNIATILMTVLSWLIVLALLLPNIAVAVRRLHDTNRSGFWYFLNFLCCIGSLVLLYFYCQPSDEGENEYGELEE